MCYLLESHLWGFSCFFYVVADLSVILVKLCWTKYFYFFTAAAAAAMREEIYTRYRIRNTPLAGNTKRGTTAVCIIYFVRYWSMVWPPSMKLLTKSQCLWDQESDPGAQHSVFFIKTFFLRKKVSCVLLVFATTPRGVSHFCYSILTPSIPKKNTNGRKYGSTGRLSSQNSHTKKERRRSKNILPARKRKRHVSDFRFSLLTIFFIFTGDQHWFDFS